MAAQTTSSNQLDDLVGQAVGEYFQYLESGKQPQLSEFVERYPEIRELLKTVIPALQAAEGASGVVNDAMDASDDHKQLGDFRILRQIGRGGMGIVYEADQISMKRRVALKVLPLAGLVDDMKIRRFQNEVRAVAALDHPNIVSVYMIGQERGVHYYAMRLIRGRSLSEVISSLRQVRDEGDGLDGATISHVTDAHRIDDLRGAHGDESTVQDTRQLDEDGGARSAEAITHTNSSTIPHSSKREYFRSVVALGIQAASALQHAHEQGIIHRDIKPGNLLLDDSAKLYVTDFGLARIEADAGVTMTGDLIGTLRYMAPEQALAKRVTVDHRADIYSLAATLYELLTLQPAYRAPDRQHLLKQIAFEEPMPLRRMDREIPTELETIIHKAMSKDMDQRYASAKELADDLRLHLENRPIKAKPPTTSEIISKWTRRNPTVAWATIITLTLMTMTLGISLFAISTQWRISMKAEEKTKRASEEATSLANELKRRNYLLHIASANRALIGNDKDYVHAQAELDICPTDQRGWEWEFLTQRVRTTFPMSFRGRSERLTADGQRLFTIGESGTPRGRIITAWDLETGTATNLLQHNAKLNSIAISNDQQWIAGGDWDGNLIVWNAESGAERWRISTNGADGHPNRINSVAFSPDDQVIATTYNNRRLLVVFDATSGEEEFALGPFQDSPHKVSFSPDGRWIVTGMGNGMGQAMIINVATGEIATHFSQDGGNMQPTFDPSGERIATANVDGTIRLWSWDGMQLENVLSWPAVHSHSAGDRRIFNVAYCTDGTYLASTDRKNAVKVWNAATGELLATLKSRDAVYGLKFRPGNDRHPANEQIMLGSATIGTRFWRWRDGESGITAKPLNGAVGAKFSPDGRHILASTPMYFTGGNLYYHRHAYYPPEPAAILSADSGSKTATTDEAIYAATWSPDGREIIATPATGDAIRTYDVATGEATSRSFTGHTGRFTISRYSPTRGGRLMSFSTDRTLRVFDYRTSEKVLERRFSVGDTKVYHGTTAAFSHDADMIGLGQSVYGVQQETPVQLHETPGHWMKRMVFSTDGQHVYAGFSGGLLAQYDTTNGAQTQHFVGHSGYVRSIALSPDEKYIVAGDTFGQAIVWDVASQQPLVTLTAGERIITSLDWSSDGRRIVAGKEDGSIEIWTLPASR